MEVKQLTQVSIACLLLKITFDPLAAQPLLKPSRCPTCVEGYFVMKNCSAKNGRTEGVQCKPCTDCSAADQHTLVQCSTFADSLCGNKTRPAVTATATPPEPAASAPDVWIVLIVIVLSSFLVLLLSLLLTLLSCRQRQHNKLKGLDLL